MYDFLTIIKQVFPSHYDNGVDTDRDTLPDFFRLEKKKK